MMLRTTIGSRGIFLCAVSCVCLLDGLRGALCEKPPLRPLPAAIALWDGPAPLALGKTEEDIPAVTPYLLPPLSDGQGRPSMVICPGGAYGSRAPREGDYYAHWLNELGINAFVLRYRTGSHGYRHPVMLMDVSRAVRFLRAHAKDYGVDPHRVGVIGSSAGGHLASTLLTHFEQGTPGAEDAVEREPSRPDLGVLVYPVISMRDKLTHAKSRRRLLGEKPDPELVELLSNENRVRVDTPPVFIAHSRLDRAVPSANSLLFAQALDAHKVPYELHIYEQGDHGFALGTGDVWMPSARHPWVRDCEDWLQRMGWAGARTAPLEAQ